jgi:nicotinamide mononucleotide transporter
MLAAAFTVWGAAVTWLEIVAFVLALACVAGNVAQRLWAWPLAIVSCLLYGWLFAAHRIYGDAALQVFFVLASLWGWWQWRFGRRPGQGADEGLRVTTLDARGRLILLGAWVLLWLILGGLLDAFTDSDVPWLDALPTAGSLLGQLLLARKVLENWWVWIGVDVASIALFAHKQLWLSVLLYAIFLGLATLGLLRWRADLTAAVDPARRDRATISP